MIPGFCFIRKRLKYIVLITRLCALILPGLLISRPARAQSGYFSEGYWIENFRKEQGLPENIIDNIMQDRKGYIWLTTPYYLVRYDGYEFKVYSAHDQLTDEYMEFKPGMIEDSRGILWCATFASGLIRFDPHTGKFRRFSAETSSNPLSSDHPNFIFEDEQQNIWVGSEKGLDRLTDFGDSVHVRQFSIFSTAEKALNTIDRICSQYPPVVNLTRVGNRTSKSTSIEIKKTGKYLVFSEGEIDANMAPSDFGWIENSRGEKIWIMDSLHCLPAGGGSENKFQFNLITLTAGTYKVSYTTDNYHAWGEWNDAPPTRPDLWGIQMFSLPAFMNDSLNAYLENISSLSGHGYSMEAMLKDVDQQPWILTNAGIERYILPTEPSGKLTSQLFIIPARFFPDNSIVVLDSNRFILNGHVIDKLDQRSLRAFLIFNHRTGTFQLSEDNAAYQQIISPNAFLKDKRNNFWLGTFDDQAKGLYLSDGNTELPHFRQFDPRSPALKSAVKLYQDQIWSVFEDRTGNIWVGTRRGGLFKIKNIKSPVQFVNVSIPGNGKSGLSFKDIAEDADGTIWLNAMEKGIFNYNLKTNATHTYNNLSNADSVKAHFSGSEARVLLFTGKGNNMRYLSGRSGIIPVPVHIPDSLAFFDRDAFGNFWTYLKNPADGIEKFFIYNGSGFQPIYFDSTLVLHGHIRQIYFDSKGNVWLCRSHGGVHQYKLDNNTRKLSFVHRHLLDRIDVFTALEDSKGMIWFGTYNEGLIRLNPVTNQYSYFNTKTGLPSNTLYRLIPFGSKIWLITDVGTAFFDTEKETVQINKELDNYFKQEDINFSLARPYDFRNLYTKYKSDEILVAAANGFYRFKPENFRIDTVKPVLQISGLNIGGKDIVLEDSPQATKMEFSYNQNDIEINYIGIQYNYSSQTQYAYLLKGANTSWVMAGTYRIARYSKLAPGYYEFYLKAANADGVWTSQKKMFEFTILAPWWRRWWAYSIYILMLGSMVWSFIVYRSAKLRKENILLETKVTERTSQLNQSIDSLKTTQAQLIQSEKMASLGELTAGIAHEIQNPLNFVNNFSEVNTELIDEMQHEIDKGNLPMIREISNEIRSNEQKINHHGKRADSIVKGMLQHSRSQAGQKELVDLNSLADEYLRLSYHGLRAKDNLFNATMRTEYDPAIPKTMMLPQDMGRVLMNLFNNAFYSVMENKKLQGADFEPTLWIKTGIITNQIFISIKDNGTGIPRKVRDKIFQPFFTTKPTGQGTGLGLSLSYDIVKAHGGEIRVDSREGEFTEFVVQIPAV